MGTAYSKENYTIPEIGTHKVFVTDQIGQTAPETIRQTGFGIPKTAPTGDTLHQSFPEAE